MINTKQILIFFFATVLVLSGIIFAGTITAPAGSPESTFITLDDLYSKISDDSYTEEAHTLAPAGGSVAPTGYSLLTIWELLSGIQDEIVSENITSGDSVLGVDGTYDISNLTPNNVVSGTTYGTSSVGTMTE